MKTVIFSLLLSFISIVSFGQIYSVTISGTVTEEDSGNPVPNQMVEIWNNDSLLGYPYQSTVFTDQYGFYVDTMNVPTGLIGYVYAATFGCDGQVTQNAAYSPSNANVVMDFSICTDSTGGSYDCQADFWYYYDSIDFYTIHFVDASQGNPDNWYWDFGDSTFSNEQNPVHIYSTQGEYLVSLTISSDSCSSTIQQIVFVGDSVGDCQAMFFAYPQDGDSLNFLTMQFVDMSIGANGLPPQSWYWDFGDSTFSYEQNPVHTYAQPGFYNVCLTISSDSAGNCEDTYCTEVEVIDWGAGCQAMFFYYPDDSLNIALTYQFEDESGGNPDSWYWDFGDGTYSTEQNPVHTFDATGEYQVCLTISNTQDSCSDTFCQLVWVTDDSTGYDCRSWFTYEILPDSAGNGTIVSFQAFTSSQNPTVFSWDFGDGATGTGQSVYHTYVQSGMYQVLLTAIDSIGCVSEYMDFVWIGDSSNFSISGDVYVGDSLPADDATVYLMTLDTLDYGLITIDQTQLSNGHYEFSGVGLENCIYFVQAELNDNSTYYGNYAPTYHIDAVNWEEAWPVFPLFYPGTSYDIVMQAISKAASGNGTISGVINGNLTRGMLSNVEVLLLDENGNVLTYTRSDENGHFGFDNLAYGNYTIYTEIVGIETVPGQVTLSENNPSVNVSVTVANGEAILGMKENGYYVKTIGNIYPNPVTASSNLNVTLNKATGLNVTIVNQFGQVLNSKNYKLSEGAHRLQLDANNLPAGLYFVKIVPDDHVTITRKFVKTR